MSDSRQATSASVSILLWSVTTMLGALAGSYGTLLLSRVLLGLVSATAGPAIASLTGDYFPSNERARAYTDTSRPPGLRWRCSR
jgi:MFS family permease